MQSHKMCPITAQNPVIDNHSGTEPCADSTLHSSAVSHSADSIECIPGLSVNNILFIEVFFMFVLNAGL